MNEKAVFMRVVDEREDEMYASIGNDGDDSETEEIVEGEEMGLRTGAKRLVSGDEVGKKPRLPSQTRRGSQMG